MGAQTFQKRRFQKLCGQAEWYKVKQEDMQELEPWGYQQQGGRRTPRTSEQESINTTDKYIESCLFVPFTPESRLKTALARLESRMGFKTRFKVIEEVGQTLCATLVKKYPNPKH